MNPGTVKCFKCGRSLFEVTPAKNAYGKKIFKSYAVKENDGKQEYYCYDCYKNLNGFNANIEKEITND